MDLPVKISDFSPHLFWDVDLKHFDLQQHKIQLTEKVLEYGLLKDWQLLKKLYGLEEIKNISLNIRNLSAVTLSFLATYFNIEEKEFRCYKHRQLVQNVWNS
jgi:hypothetical protein